MKSLAGKKVVIIGAGVGGLATAGLLARAGCEVEVYESCEQVGGRMGLYEADGYKFDTGPSWYLMPEVYEHFFALMGKTTADYYQLQKLEPAYQVFFEGDPRPLTITGNEAVDGHSFASYESGADIALTRYLDSAQSTYELALKYFLYHDYYQPWRLMNPSVVKALPKFLQIAGMSLDTFVSRSFKHPQLRQVLEYPAVFLGASPFSAPGLYHLMSYLDFRQGVLYPKGGLHSVTRALQNMAEEAGATIHTRSAVNEIIVDDGKATAIALDNGHRVAADIVISNADLHHTQIKLLAREHRDYSEKYWNKHEVGPSALLMYLGVKGDLPELEHHNLFFVKNWQDNFASIFDGKQWPEPASIYVCKPSGSDEGVAPRGQQNLFVLVPLPANTDLNASKLDEYADIYLEQIAKQSGISDLRSRIVSRKLFGPKDFESDFNAWQGTALGMSHLLRQSALFRPGVKSKRVKNLYYVGANVQPGIGVPMCLISAELVYKSLIGNHSLGPLPEPARDQQ